MTAVVCCAAVAVAFAAQTAHADVLEDIYNATDQSLQGSISFPGLTGTDAKGVVFSFQGFTESDITSIGYILDPSTLTVAALEVTAMTGYAGCEFAIDSSCQMDLMSLSQTSWSVADYTCGSAGDCGESGSTSNIYLAPVHVIEDIYNATDHSLEGSISFPGLTGTNATGVVFSFQGFTESDITSIGYILDPSTLTVAALEVTAMTGYAGCEFAIDSSCQMDLMSLSQTSWSVADYTCGSAGDCGESGSTSNIYLAPVASPAAVTPEPSSVALLATGALGMAGVLSRRVLGQRLDSRDTTTPA